MINVNTRANIARTLARKPRPKDLKALLVTVNVYDDHTKFNRGEQFSYATRFGNLWLKFEVYFNYIGGAKHPESLGVYSHAASRVLLDSSVLGFEVILDAMIQRLIDRMEYSLSEIVIGALKQ